MDKLTSRRVNGIKQGYWSPAKKEELVQRLGAYESTELTPEEIVAMKSGGTVKTWTGVRRWMGRWHDAQREQPDMTGQDWVLGVVNGEYKTPAGGTVIYIDAIERVSYDSELGWWMEDWPSIEKVRVSWWTEMPSAPGRTEEHGQA